MENKKGYMREFGVREGKKKMMQLYYNLKRNSPLQMLP